MKHDGQARTALPSGTRRRVLLVLVFCLFLAGLVFLSRFFWLSQETVPGPETPPLVLGEASPTQAGWEQGAWQQEATGGVMVTVPFGLAGSERVDAYQHTRTLESWRLVCEQPCRDYALGVLERVHSQGLELVEAGFMDLSGECWGCVLRGSEGESLMVMLIPERPFSPRSDTNRLVVTILHYLQPEDSGLWFEESA